MKVEYKNTLRIIFLFAVLGLPQIASALTHGEGIVRDTNGDYLITYMSSEEGKLIQVRYVPPNKISPSLKSKFIETDNTIVYRYQVSNKQGAQLSIIGLLFDSLSSVSMANNKTALAVIAQPPFWDGDALHDVAKKLRVFWIASNNAEIRPNGVQSGFGFSSSDLPGVADAKLSGNSLSPSFMGDPDVDITAMYDKLVKETSFVPHNAAVPTIAVPVPFDAATLLNRIRTHFLTWQGKQLVEPTFASQLDRYLVAAAEAFRRNQIKAGKEHLETIHELLEKEHKHLDGDDDDEAEKQDKEHRTATRPNIDRLAARVLDFDLKYVLKRLEPLEDSRKKETQDNR